MRVCLSVPSYVDVRQREERKGETDTQRDTHRQSLTAVLRRVSYMFITIYL